MRAGVWCVLLGACTGTQGTPTMSPPAGVATLNVTLEGDGSLDPNQVNLAIVWMRDKDVWPARGIEMQQLLITKHSLSWPVTFEARMLERPTYDPYWSSPQVGFRYGWVVAYVDDNHNDTLDFTPIDSDHFTDRIVGFTLDDQIHYYTTVDQLTQCTDIYGTDSDISTPLTLQAHAAPAESCHLLADWRPYFEYAHVFGGSGPGPDPGPGPWDWDAASDAPCPANLVPDGTSEISCDIPAPAYQFHAMAFAQTSAFISQTCGMVERVCEGWRMDPNAPGPWPCPCDSTKYYCTDSEGGL